TGLEAQQVWQLLSQSNCHRNRRRLLSLVVSASHSCYYLQSRDMASPVSEVEAKVDGRARQIQWNRNTWSTGQ
ncbi:hypothetical protein Celaphus_00015326, partial [Cervus elaphus hippelaphus]